ncbi:MAG: polymer-forming cytoskeletal protein [Saprospiraceae bacterium]|nr:polymer-forming cytoskeletal protein [Saprospiraceae bacterium]
MFGNTKNSEEIKTPSVAGALNALVKGTLVEGTVRCDSDLRVDGTIKGKLTCKSKVIIGPTGVVEGEIECQNAVIEGRFKGVLTVSELLNVRETAEMDGEIVTNKLLVQSGARFNVSCKMEVGKTNGAVKDFDPKAPNDAANTAKQVIGGKAEVRN